MIGQSEHKAAWLFIAPAVLLLIAVNIVPFGYALWLSIHNVFLGRGAPQFVGLDNYTWLLKDTRFHASLWTSLKLVSICVSLQVGVGLPVALAFNANLRGFQLVRSLTVLPLIVAPPVVGLLWLYMFYDKVGVISHVAAYLGYADLSFLTSKNLAIGAIALADTWQWTPLVVAILFAALQAMPEYVYEAARMDGLSKWQTFKWITLPLLLPSLTVVILLRALDTFRNFDLIFMMTRGGPGGTTETLSWYIYQTGFQGLDIGSAAAMSVLMIVLVTMLAQLVVRNLLKPV